jgi:hypothetical protein
MNTFNIFKIIGVLFVVLIFAQYMLSNVNTNYKPSEIFKSIEHQLKVWFEWLGALWGYISAFLIHLELEQIAYAIKDIFMPIFGIIFSWTSFFKGYFDYIASIAKKYAYALTFAGSCILIALLVYIIYRFRVKISQSKPYILLRNLLTKISCRICRHQDKKVEDKATDKKQTITKK